MRSMPSRNVQPEPGVEPAAMSVARRPRHAPDDVQLELIQQPGRQDLTQQCAPSRDRDVLAASGVLGQSDGPLDPVASRT